MRVLIIGGYGFIGSHVAETMLERGDDVRIFDRPGASKSRIARIEKEVEIIEGDFTVPEDILAALESVDAVAHLACTTTPATSNADIAADVQTNLVGTLKMLNAVVESGVERVLFASSGGTIYGPAEDIPIAEDRPTAPVCSNGIHKLAVEKYLALLNRLHGLEWTALRASNPYGIAQSPDSGQGAVSAFAHAMKKGNIIHIWGDGETVRDYFHVSDLADAYAEVLQNPPPSRIYNIGSGRGTSLNELIKILSKVSGIEPKVEYLPARASDVPANVLDCSRAGSELGWAAKISIEDGVREYFEEE